ncbi:MAG: sulfurtransferase [Caldilineaceae bacterium]|nr:sulfurtransferase [Caldilineaceae bacterium]
MPYTLLISTDELAHRLDDPDWAVIDCRFDLNDTAKGRAAYLDAHIPGAIYAHLDEDLSSPIVPGATGRHPLPTPDVFAAQLSRWGIDAKTQVVVYDDAGGLYAGRLWWMLRWLGHDAVALLDGGWQQWVKEVRPTLGGEDTRSPRTFVPHVQEEMLADVDEVLANLENDEFVLVDVRDEARYRGEVSGLDPVGGHIPGAVSAHYGHNLAPDGRFKTADELRAYYEDLLADPDAGVVPEGIVFYCGSGVSAAHDLLAMELAGLGRHRLYVGSWSHWITDPSRPVATVA